MATQVSLNDGAIASAGALAIQTNGTTQAVSISTGQVATLAKDAVIQGVTVGRGAGAVATNTAVGASALAANTSGSYQTAVGYQAGQAVTTATYSTFLGSRAGQATTTGQVTFVGDAAGYANTTGTNNTAIGQDSLSANTTGGYNTAVGQSALRSNTTASNNTAVGYQAGYTNSTGANNVFLGGVAGYSSSGSSNLHVGYGAGYSSTGSNNTFVGAFGTGSTACGGSMTTGSKNTILGAYSGNQGGLDIRTASNHIVLSDGDGNPRGVFDNSGNLLVGATSTLGSTAGILVANSGANVQAITTNSTSSSAYYIGRFYSGGTEKGYIYFDGTNVSYTNLSDYRLKENVQPMQNALDKVAQLNPVTYNWKSNGKDGQGFIAHELQAVVPDCVTGDKDAVDEDGNPKYQGIDTSFLVATLTAAIQEQQALIQTLTARITALESA